MVTGEISVAWAPKYLHMFLAWSLFPYTARVVGKIPRVFLRPQQGTSQMRITCPPQSESARSGCLGIPTMTQFGPIKCPATAMTERTERKSARTPDGRSLHTYVGACEQFLMLLRGPLGSFMSKNGISPERHPPIIPLQLPRTSLFSSPFLPTRYPEPPP